MSSTKIPRMRIRRKTTLRTICIYLKTKQKMGSWQTETELAASQRSPYRSHFYKQFFVRVNAIMKRLFTNRHVFFQLLCYRVRSIRCPFIWKLGSAFWGLILVKNKNNQILWFFYTATLKFAKFSPE